MFLQTGPESVSLTEALKTLVCHYSGPPIWPGLSSLTKDVQLIDEASLCARRVGVTQKTVQKASSEKVAENSIGLGLLFGVAAGDITNVALGLSVVKSRRL